MKPFIQLATKHRRKLHSSALAFFFSCRDPFAHIPSFLTGSSDVPKKSSCGPSWSFSRKPKHQTIIQWHITGKTYRAGQQGRQNTEWTEFAISGFVGNYSLQHRLTHQRSILQPGPHICRRPPEAETWHAEVLSQEVLHGPFFTDNCHKQQQKTCNWRTSGGQL